VKHVTGIAQVRDSAFPNGHLGREGQMSLPPGAVNCPVTQPELCPKKGRELSYTDQQVMLRVPFEQGQHAKALGAKWCPIRRAWWCPRSTLAEQPDLARWCHHSPTVA